jgi:hypothetical protein
MAKFKAKVKGFDGSQIREAGEVFEFAGKPGKWMIPMESVVAVPEAPADDHKGKKSKKHDEL